MYAPKYLLAASAALLVVAAACAPADDAPAADPTTEELASPFVDSVMLAEEMYDEAVFDTITWETEMAAMDRGRVVFQYSCQKCHGTEGRGDGGFVLGDITLTPPSFATPDWRFAGDKVALRRQVFVGTNAGMPHWGFHGLKFRDIDAVASYILGVLR